MSSSEVVNCIDLYGNKVAIPKERIAIRPSVYGIIMHDGRMLVCNTKSTGKYSLPGGGIDIGEKIEDALRREVYEECGIEIEIDGFVNFEERFFYYNPTDDAWQVYAFFYLCKPKTFEFLSHDVHEVEAENPQWVEINSLREEDFQAFGRVVLESLQNHSPDQGFLYEKNRIVTLVISITTFFLVLATNTIRWDETPLEQSIAALPLGLGLLLELPFIFVGSLLTGNGSDDGLISYHWHAVIMQIMPFIVSVCYGGLFYVTVTRMKK